MKQTDPQFKLRLPEDLKERVEVAAQESKRSMNAEIVHRLQSSFSNKSIQLVDDESLAEAVLERTGILLAEFIKDRAQQNERHLFAEIVSLLQHQMRDDRNPISAVDVRLERLEGLIRGIAGQKEDGHWEATHRAGVLGRVLLALLAFENAGSEPRPLTRASLLNSIRDESTAAISAAHGAAAHFPEALKKPLDGTALITDLVLSMLPEGLLDVDSNWGEPNKDPLLNGKFERYLGAEKKAPSDRSPTQKADVKHKEGRIGSSHKRN